jgi:hypothetical protein
MSSPQRYEACLPILSAKQALGPHVRKNHLANNAFEHSARSGPICK